MIDRQPSSTVVKILRSKARSESYYRAAWTVILTLKSSKRILKRSLEPTKAKTILKMPSKKMTILTQTIMKTIVRTATNSKKIIKRTRKLRRRNKTLSLSSVAMVKVHN